MFRSAADTKHVLIRFAVYHDHATTASFLLFYETVMKGKSISLLLNHTITATFLYSFVFVLLVATKRLYNSTIYMPLSRSVCLAVITLLSTQQGATSADSRSRST